MPTVQRIRLVSRSVARCVVRSATWLLLAATAVSCGERGGRGDGVVALPPELRELSGMVMVAEDLLACVQDEFGSVFYLEVSGEGSLRMVEFGPGGDYEGIASTPGGLWVLRSDGALHELVADGAGLRIRETYVMPFEGDFEGLCYDADSNCLLVLPKGRVAGKRKEKSRRRVFGFDLAAMKPLPKPVLTLRIDEVEKQIEERELYAPRRKTKKGKQRVDVSMAGSELLVLPGGDLLLLMSKDRMLLRVDRQGGVVATAELDAELFEQPESMALLPDGRLLVGSEGRSRSALIAFVEIPVPSGQ